MLLPNLQVYGDIVRALQLTKFRPLAPVGITDIQTTYSILLKDLIFLFVASGGENGLRV